MDEDKKPRKPRICEVLGVEPLEEWTVKGQRRITLQTDEYGNLMVKSDSGFCEEDDLLELLLNIINDPSLLVRKHRWRPEDIDGAKAVKIIWPDAKTVERTKDYETLLYIRDAGGYVMANFPARIIPSIACGETVDLTEILGTEEQK